MHIRRRVERTEVGAVWTVVIVRWVPPHATVLHARVSWTVVSSTKAVTVMGPLVVRASTQRFSPWTSCPRAEVTSRRDTFGRCVMAYEVTRYANSPGAVDTGRTSPTRAWAHRRRVSMGFWHVGT